MDAISEILPSEPGTLHWNGVKTFKIEEVSRTIEPAE